METNDPNHTEVVYPLICQGSCYNNVTTIPEHLDFQVITTGTQVTLQQKIHWITNGCQIKPQIELADAGEFELSAIECTQTTCQVGVTFSPTTAGVQTALLNFTFSDTNKITVPIKGEATAAETQFEITPLTHYFGTVKAGRGPGNVQLFTIHNTRDNAFWLKDIYLDQTTNFSLQAWECIHILRVIQCPPQCVARHIV